MCRPMQGREDVACQRVPLFDKRRNQRPVCVLVALKLTRCRLDIAMEENRRSVVERMGERNRWLDPFEAVLAEGECGENGGGHGHRMDRRADVVSESRNREGLRSRAAADRR